MLGRGCVLITVNYNCLSFSTSLPTLRPLMYLHRALCTHPAAPAAACESKPREQQHKVSPCATRTHTPQQSGSMLSPEADTALHCHSPEMGKAKPPQQSTHPQHLLPSHLAEPWYRRVTTKLSEMYWLLFFCCYYLLQHSLGLQY